MRDCTPAIVVISLILLVPLPALADGQSLFLGTTPFKNGGPPCASCHDAAGLPFPHGGGLGPDLSRAAAKLGPAGLEVSLQTLYFPTMSPIFRSRPLTQDEQNQLKAFLMQSGQQPARSGFTLIVVGTAVGGFLMLLALTAFAWRYRIREVRLVPMITDAKERT